MRNVLHFDGKICEDTMDGVYQSSDRTAVLTTSPDKLEREDG